LLRRTLNLGILAHVDAGKTTLTERLLHAAGVIDELGSVDDGTTQTDFLELERRRGITIKSAVVSFRLDGLTVNLIDTPGHPDFIAEVERVLGVLDGVVLVVSAVEGVQAQTRVLMRALRRLRLPTLLFVNKVDRRGADPDRVLRHVAATLSPSIVPMGMVAGAGGGAAAFSRWAEGDVAFAARLVDVLGDHDDELAAAYLEDESAVSPRRLWQELTRQTSLALVHPVFLGSAKTGAGIDALVAGIVELLPSAGGDPEAPFAARVFKIERGAAGEKIAYARVVSGTVRVRDRIGRSKVTALAVFETGSTVRSTSAAAGTLCKLWGLAEARVGDELTTAGPRAVAGESFARPTLEAVVVPCRTGDRGALQLALSQLAEQDPLIDLHRVGPAEELSLVLYGEVQKEVIESTLADQFALEVEFHETSTIHIERPAGTGEAVEPLAKGGSTPFLAGIGLRVEPGPVGQGVEFRLEVELGSMPIAFFRAVEETVRETLLQGLFGWEVTDCLVALTYSGYYPRQSHAHATFDKSMSSTAGDFRNLTPLVLMDALRRAGTHVYEPLVRVALEVPSDTAPAFFPVLGKLGATLPATAVRGPLSTLETELPAARVQELRRRLPALTRGEGSLEAVFSRHRAVVGVPPTRPRTDANPLDRDEYLLHTARRIGAR
jgi:ribosomal protection tetracycline resistance protein